MRIILRLFLLLFLLALGAVAASFYAYRVPLGYAGQKTVVIVPKAGVKGILEQLRYEGLVPRYEIIALPILLTTDYKKLKAGEYEFAAGMSPADIVDKIIRGEVVVHKVTIPEGWTVYQVREALMKEPLLSGELPATIAEGSLMPDTILFQRGETRASIVKRMQEAQTKLLSAAWEKRTADLPYATPQEALTMASIVERETGEMDERAQVAGVFINRLHKGMMLQTDPSVIYGMMHQQGGKPMDRPLSRADLGRDTPYNTYTRYGLTPTPICNPGKKSIEAALNPAATDALYFVATGHGGHRFAATLKEHEANVKAYREVMRAQAAATAAVPN